MCIRDSIRSPKRDADREATEKEQTVVIDSKIPRKPEPTPFAVLVWDDQGRSIEPEKFYSEVTYPNCALFHVWPTGIFHIPRKVWPSYELLLTLLIGGDLP